MVHASKFTISGRKCPEIIDEVTFARVSTGNVGRSDVACRIAKTPVRRRAMKVFVLDLAHRIIFGTSGIAADAVVPGCS